MSRGGQLDPRLTGYFECHGTGSAVSDPLEVHAVANATNESRNAEDRSLFIGAFKTNIGHSGAASGLSAVIKVILTMERDIITSSRGVVTRSPAINWKNGRLKSQMTLRDSLHSFPSSVSVLIHSAVVAPMFAKSSSDQIQRLTI
jgi:acyl transferase domain-containing protein